MSSRKELAAYVRKLKADSKARERADKAAIAEAVKSLGNFQADVEEWRENGYSWRGRRRRPHRSTSIGPRRILQLSLRDDVYEKLVGISRYLGGEDIPNSLALVVSYLVLEAPNPINKQSYLETLKVSDLRGRRRWVETHTEEKEPSR